MKMRPFGRLLPVPTALARLARVTRPVGATESVALEAALGRVAARAYAAPAAVPSFPRASWDGYAVRSVDTRAARASRAVKLRVVGDVYAEGGLGRPLRSGEAVAIATGGAVPRGADAVVMFEEVDRSGSSISIRHPVPRGDRIAAPGDDFPRGARLVVRGTELGAPDLGALAAVGFDRVEVYRAPVATIIPNGNELVRAGRRLRRGEIYESNNVSLGAVLQGAGAVVRAVPPISDDEPKIERAIRDALRSSDLVVVTGGSSVGEHDYLPSIFPRVGRLLFHGFAVRPGKPTLAAVAGDRLLLGMPGHPTSCLLNAYWLLLPLVRKMAHRPGPGWVEGDATLGATLEGSAPPFTRVVPFRVERGVARPTFHGSSAITSLSGANAYTFVPPGAPPRTKGSRLRLRFLLPPLATPG